MGTRFICFIAVLALSLALLWGCVVKKSSTAVVEYPGLVLVSPSFGHGEAIPARHACHGPDLSPELKWSEPPEGTGSFLLVVSAADAPLEGGRTLWVLAGIPPAFRSLPEGMPPGKFLKNGLRQRANAWGKSAYRGPCPRPKSGRHRYYFVLYALDVGPEVEVSEGLAEKRALAKATLMGCCER